MSWGWLLCFHPSPKTTTKGNLMEIKVPVSELKSVLPVLAQVVPRHSPLLVLRMLRVTHYETGTI